MGLLREIKVENVEGLKSQTRLRVVDAIMLIHLIPELFEYAICAPGSGQHELVKKGMV